MDEVISAHGGGTHIPLPANWPQVPRNWIWFAVLTAAVLLTVYMAMGVQHPATSSIDHAAESCLATIDAELAFFVDVPGAVDASTMGEILARLGEQLDAPYTGLRRVSLFSSRRRGATPLIAVCTRPPLFASLLGRQGTDPALRARLVGVVRAELEQQTEPTTGQTLTQVLADVSVSKYSRSPMNTLVIFSGLRETWPSFDPRRCEGVQAAIAAYRRARAGGVERPAFKSATIHLNVIPEPGAGPDVARCRRAFWNWYFGDVDGKSVGVSWDYLPGSMSVAKQLTEEE